MLTKREYVMTFFKKLPQHVFTWILVFAFLAGGCDLLENGNGVEPRNPEEVMFQRIEVETQDRHRFHLIHFLSKQDIVAATNIYTYNDGGDLWLSSDGGIDFEITRGYVAPLRGSFSFVDEKTGYVAGWRSGFGVSMFIGKTTDGGQTWDNLMDSELSNLRDLIPVNIDPRNIAAIGNDVCFATGGREGSGRIFGSRAAGVGSSWVMEVSDIDFYAGTLDAIDGRFYIATHSEFMFKHPGGEWQTLDAPWDHEDGLVLNDMVFASQSRGWALVQDNNAADDRLTLYYTDNGGESWQAQNSSPRAERETAFPRLGQLLYFDHMLFGISRMIVEDGPERIYMVISADNGKSWTHNDWTEHGNWSIRLIEAAGELRVYQFSSSRIDMGYYGVYKP